MSRIGNQPIAVPSGVKINLLDRHLTVEGRLGRLSLQHHPKVRVVLEQGGAQVRVERLDDERLSRSLHGLTRSLVSNMVTGVSQGFEKRLEIVGVGYQASLQGDKLSIQVGWAKPLVVQCPSDVTVEVPDGTHIVIKGPDKQRVGQVAADIRRRKPPEPYKGKGIRYQDEVVRRKAGKAFAGGGG